MLLAFVARIFPYLVIRLFDMVTNHPRRYRPWPRVHARVFDGRSVLHRLRVQERVPLHDMQLVARKIALGGKTYKLKFGHHGGNHPVKQLNSGKVEITAHNHNFAVDPDSLPQSEVELTHMDLNDNTLEGMRHRNLPLFTVQYHPEASPGPHDSHYLFKDFVKMMEEWKG